MPHAPSDDDPNADAPPLDAPPLDAPPLDAPPGSGDGGDDPAYPPPPLDDPGIDDGPPPLHGGEPASPDENSARKKAGAFMASLEGPVSRQQAIEYVNLQRWAREGCTTFVFVSILWLAFLIFLHRQSHIWVSYGIFHEVTQEVWSLPAKASRGIAPSQIYSAAGQSTCSCACPAMCDNPKGAGQLLPGVPAGAYLFNGTVLPEQLQTMRAKALHLRNENDMWVDGATEKIISLSAVNSIANVWFWLQNGLVPELWHEEERHSPVDTTLLFGTQAQLDAKKSTLDANEKPGHFMRWNQVIGGVRLRQRRLHTADCRGDINIGNQTKETKQKCHRKKASLVPFGLGSKSYAEGFIPDEKDRSAFDIYLDTERPLHIALETLQFMLKNNDWLDASSKSLQVQVPFLNVEATPPMFGLLEVQFSFTRSGDLTKKVDLWTVNANPYTGVDFIYLPDVVYIGCLIYLFVKKIYQAIKFFVDKRHRHDVLCNFWFMFDWATILCGLFGLVLWFSIVQESGGIGEAIVALPEAPPFDAPEATVKNFHVAWGEILDRILWMTVLRERLRLAGFWFSQILIFQFIKAFRGQPKLAQLTRTLINSFEDLTHFFVCFIVLFLTFAFTAHLVYGLRLEEWSTSTKCVNAAFRALRGDVDLNAMYDVAPLTTIVWFWLFLVANIFVMMNTLLATVYDHYQLVKNKANAFTGILLQTKDAIKDVWNREGFKVFFCRCCCRCRNRDGQPPHADMLEELMYRADYGPHERHFVFRTVLGPKWMRKKMEKHVFAGEVPADALKNKEQCPAEADLKEFMDADYYMAFLEDAENYREREFDPEEIHTNQMRELVTLCEIEMAYMRERLDTCQTHLKISMHTLANRLHHVDEIVHKSLATLHFLAGSAGVPTKKEHGIHEGDPKCEAALKDTYQRVMQHLGQGPVRKLEGLREEHQVALADLVNARSQNDTYCRIHTNARLANALGDDQRKRIARKHKMDAFKPNG